MRTGWLLEGTEAVFSAKILSISAKNASAETFSGRMLFKERSGGKMPPATKAIALYQFAVFRDDRFDAGDVFRRIHAAGRFTAAIIDFDHFDAF